MPVDLRERLIAAADEPSSGPDTEAILHRSTSRRWRARALFCGGALAMVAAALLVVRILLPSDGADVLTKPVRQPEQAGPIAVEHRPDEVIVRLLDPAADPAEVERELRAAGVEATVEAQPVVPSFVGDWVFAGSSSNALAVTVDADDRRVIRFRAPLIGSYQLAYGQPALPNETFVTSTGAFLPGEPLHCTGVERLMPSEAEQVINDLGFEVSWRLQTTTQVLPNGTRLGNSEVVAEPPEGVITGASPLSATVMVVFVSPVGDIAASGEEIRTQQRGAC